MIRALYLTIVAVSLSSSAQAGSSLTPQAYATVAAVQTWSPDTGLVFPTVIGASLLVKTDTPWMARALAGGGAVITPAGPIPLAQAGGIIGRKTGPVIIFGGGVYNLLLTREQLTHRPTGTIAVARPTTWGALALIGSINQTGPGIGGQLAYNF